MVAQATGPFAHFDLADGRQCILLAHAIQHYRSADPNTPNANIRDASPRQLETANTIAQRMRGSPLMTEIVRRFLGAPLSMLFNQPTALLERARDMEVFVTPDIYTPGSPEYLAAQDAWRAHLQTQQVVAATVINGSGSGAERPLGPSDNEVDSDSRKRKEQIRSYLLKRQADSQSSNKPKKPRDHKFVQDGADLKTAKPGVENWAKFRIRLRAEMPNPEVPGEFIPAPDVEYWYKDGKLEILDPFDFNDPEDIKRLNVWRHQLRYRHFPPTRKERAFWLDFENETLIWMIEKQLKQGKPLKWRRLTNDYNRYMKGRTQRTGMKVLKPGKKLRPQLEEDRLAPWRKATAIKLQAEKDPGTKKLILDAEEKYAKASSSGSDSHPGTAVPVAAAQNAQDRNAATPSTRPREARQLSPDDDELSDPSPEPSKNIKRPKRHVQRVYKPRKPQSAPKSNYKVDDSESEAEHNSIKSIEKEEETVTQKRKRSESQSELVEENSDDDDDAGTSGDESDVGSDATIPDVNGASCW